MTPHDEATATTGWLHLLTTEEAAALLRLAPSTLRVWRYKRTGPKSFRTGGKVLYRRDDVEAWLSDQYHKADDHS
jgi:excisionase family DNA binding protein